MLPAAASCPKREPGIEECIESLALPRNDKVIPELLHQEHGPQTYYTNLEICFLSFHSFRPLNVSCGVGSTLVSRREGSSSVNLRSVSVESRGRCTCDFAVIPLCPSTGLPPPSLSTPCARVLFPAGTPRKSDRVVSDVCHSEREQR